MSEIDKIKFHIQMLGEVIDSIEHPIASLVISMDWDGDDLNRAHDVFEKYNNMLEAKEDINWSAFEMELRNTFSIGYQTVKSIILAFYRNHQWTEVCMLYAKSCMCAEFYEIAHDSEKGI